jgi:gamma-glutamylcyclotransferase (GGCT)/AIG2-like uncharacterized protein YtfP
MNNCLFSYGTLQNEEVQLKLFGRVFKGSADTLQGYKTAAIEITDEAFLSKGEQKNQLTAIISEDKNDSIKGMAFEITEGELLLADKYEPVGYRRIKVTLASGKEAWIYVAVETA